MKKESKNIQYKQRNILVWNEVSPYYHKRWAREEVGPFNVTNELIKLSKIKSGDCVLDLASVSYTHLTLPTILRV